MEDALGHQVPAGGEVDEMFHASGAENGGEEIAGGEELVRAREVEEDGVDGVFDEDLFDPGGVLDGALEHGDSVGLLLIGDLGREASGICGGEDDVFDGRGFEEERDQGFADVAGGGGDEDVGHDIRLRQTKKG